MGRIATLTYGVMPTREQFEKGCLLVEDGDPPEACVAHQGLSFENDARVGNARLSPDELWEELQKALADFEERSKSPVQNREFAGQWISDVLWCLGIEWV